MDFSNFAYADNEQDNQKLNKNINNHHSNVIDLNDDDFDLEKETIIDIPPIEKSTKPSLHSLFMKTNKSKTVPKIEPPLVEGIGTKELYKSPGQVENRLKLLIIGHNPSYQTWMKGHYYANPANRMWHLLRQSEIIPSHFQSSNDQDCPSQCSLGFTDLMSGFVETSSNKITDSMLVSYKQSFYERLEAHCHRVQQETSLEISQSHPLIIAFAGVRQWKALFMNDSTSNKRKQISSDPILPKRTKRETNQISIKCFYSDHPLTPPHSPTKPTIPTSFDPNDKAIYGIQHHRPSDWPEVLSDSIIFLLPSSSGAAAMTNEAREEPYRQLGKLMKQITFSTPKEEIIRLAIQVTSVINTLPFQTIIASPQNNVHEKEKTKEVTNDETNEKIKHISDKLDDNDNNDDENEIEIISPNSYHNYKQSKQSLREGIIIDLLDD